MSDLQLSLLALGAVIIAAVILFNWWQERRFLQETSRRFEEPAGDILMDEFRLDPERVVSADTEPVLGGEPLEEVEVRVEEDMLLEELHVDAVPASRSESSAESVATPLEETAPAMPEMEVPPAPAMTTAEEIPPLAFGSAAQQAMISPLPEEVDLHIDLVAQAALPGNLEIPVLIEAIRQMPRFDKAVQWFLQDDTGFWHTLSAELPSGRYPQLVAALQLADRGGPVAQGMLMAFQQQVEALATTLGAELSWLGAADPLQYAAELDQFCIDVDVMVGFHVVQGSGGSIAGTKLRGLAESAGLKLLEDGAFHSQDEAGRTLFTLISQDQRPFKPETLRTAFFRGVSFQLDVPKVESTSNAFNRMVMFARQLETALEGTLVDDNQRPLGDAEIEKIRLQLRMMHDRMVARDILPGTPSALRLFS